MQALALPISLHEKIDTSPLFGLREMLPSGGNDGDRITTNKNTRAHGQYQLIFWPFTITVVPASSIEQCPSSTIIILKTEVRIL
jgi:hypothetical protein